MLERNTLRCTPRTFCILFASRRAPPRSLLAIARGGNVGLEGHIGGVAGVSAGFIGGGLGGAGGLGVGAIGAGGGAIGRR